MQSASYVRKYMINMTMRRCKNAIIRRAPNIFLFSTNILYEHACEMVHFSIDFIGQWFC